MEQVTTTLPKAELATKDWTEKEMKDLELRLEKGLDRIRKDMNQGMTTQTRWIIGMMVALILAVLLKDTI